MERASEGELFSVDLFFNAKSMGRQKGFSTLDSCCRYTDI